MTMRIILLSGPVASGKSTLCRALEHHFGMKVLVTRDLITRSLNRNGVFGRRNLQWEGERLDRLTGGAWVRDELERFLHGEMAESGVVVDAVRTLEQVRIVRDTYGPVVDHIHLTAPEQTLSARYAARSSCDERLELPAYAHVLQNETERTVDNLQVAADIVLDTGLHNEVETFRAVCAFVFPAQQGCTFR